jgi:alpha-beta hydrolase superfamily lysophospholipase
VIKHTRVDALWGLTDLMDRASAAELPPTPTLILYGEGDEIIPKRAYCRWLGTFPADVSPEPRLALYARGYHMLTRDLQAERVLADIAAWIRDPSAPLPSGEETTPGTERLAKFCGRG